MFLLGVVFEVLIVFHRAPAAAPGEAVFDKEAVAEIAFLDFVAIGLATVGIGLGVGGLDNLTTILAIADIGVVERVDVDGETTGVF